jgi:tetratricopeptide (TPR) repeat protein
MKQVRNPPALPGRAIAAIYLLAMIAAGPAFAVSGGANSNAHNCKPGTHWSKSAKKCVINGSSKLDEDLYEEGRALALAGHYRQALDLLLTIKTRDSMTMTMIGYAKRKSGEIGEGMAFYRQALAIDPDNANTREYLGEAYVAIGRPDLAKIELAKLEVLCGTSCEQYEDLARAIAGKPGAGE